MRGSGRTRPVRGMPSRKVRLMLSGALVLAAGAGIVAASTGSADREDATRVAIGAAVTEASPAAEEPAGTGQPAPAGSLPGVWWLPGGLVWVFDPSTNSGYQKEYRPIGSAEPFRHQRAFTYDSTGSGVRVSFLSMTSADPHDENLTSLSYDNSDDVLRVVRDGSGESWFGCSSSEMPALATVLC